MPSTSMPLRGKSQEATELELHISPARSSSRPHAGAGIDSASSTRRWATIGSADTRTGLSIAEVETTGFSSGWLRSVFLVAVTVTDS